MNKQELIKVSFNQAIELLRANISVLGKETVPISQALHKTLATTIKSKVNIPQKNISAMDGYALSAIPATNPCELSLADKLVPGHAIRVLTGQTVPDNTLAIVPEEFCTISRGKILVQKNLSSYENVRFAGEDIKTNEIAALVGDELSPALIARLAAIGEASVQVFKTPKVSIITSGDELQKPGTQLVDSQRRYECDSYLLSAMLKEQDAEPLTLPHIPDNKKAAIKAIESAIKTSDMIISCGGASNSEADHIRPALRELGAQILFDRVAIKPGRPCAFAILANKPVLVLPGNPVAVYVSFYAIVLSALRTMRNQQRGESPTATCLDAIKADKQRDLFIRMNLSINNGQLLASPYLATGSGLIDSILSTNALGFVPAGCAVQPGEQISIFKIIRPQNLWATTKN